MKFICLVMMLLLCLSTTSCSISDKQNDAGESSVTAPDIFLHPPATISSDVAVPNVSSPVVDTNSQDNGSENEIDLSAYFDGLSGTAIFLYKSGNYTVYNIVASELQVSPCSTFKIISTLAAFEYDVVTPSQSVIAWDGTKWTFESWNRDLTIAEAFQSSCVWYYRKLTDQIGKGNMIDFINTLNYGNCDISQWEGSGFNRNPLVGGFWLESSLLISPREQIDVMHRIFEGKTEIDESSIAELKKMMYKEDMVAVLKYMKKQEAAEVDGLSAFLNPTETTLILQYI